MDKMVTWKPSLKDFENLCERACRIMNKKAGCEPGYYVSKGAQILEDEVVKALNEAAEGTEFMGKIKKISGQRFPDIVIAERYGVEVKSTKEDRWAITGGSVAEGTRVEDVEAIFILFGKLSEPVEFKTRRYEECLCDIAVTHSPRYKIDMNLPKGETIFDKMEISYSDLNKLSEPINRVVQYFRETLKKGESLWWVNGEDAAAQSVPATIRMLESLPKNEREELIAQGFAHFPEMFSSEDSKYERFASWLVAKHGVVSSHLRDYFSASGQKDMLINGVLYQKVPNKYYRLYKYRRQVKEIIMEDDVLDDSMNSEFELRMIKWIGQVSEYAKKENFKVEDFLIKLFKEE